MWTESRLCVCGMSLEWSHCVCGQSLYRSDCVMQLCVGVVYTGQTVSNSCVWAESRLIRDSVIQLCDLVD